MLSAVGSDVLRPTIQQLAHQSLLASHPAGSPSGGTSPSPIVVLLDSSDLRASSSRGQAAAALPAWMVAVELDREAALLLSKYALSFLCMVISTASKFYTQGPIQYLASLKKVNTEIGATMKYER